MSDLLERDVSPALLASIIRGVDRTTLATIATVTCPSLIKRGNPFWDAKSQCWLIRKQAITSVMIGGTYAGAVTNRRFKEWAAGSDQPLEFKSQGRAWGERLKGVGSANRRGKRASIVSHKGQLYLDVQALRVLSITYVGIDGVAIPATVIQPFLRTRKKSTKQGLEHEVTWRDYRLENIRQVRMNGQAFNVRVN